MDIRDVACFFDDDPVYDGYTGTLLFYGHTAAHDDHTSSGATARRRTLTTIDTTVAPARGVIQIYAECWLISDSNPDAFQGKNIRRSYSLKKSTGLMAHVTPGEAALGSTGTPIHAQKEYFRDQANAHTESDWDVMWNVFVALAEPVVKGSFLRQDGALFRVRNLYQSIDKYRILEADQFDSDALQNVTFTSAGTVNLATGLLDVTSVAVPAIQTDTQKFYEFRTQGESAQQPGDRTVWLAKTSYTPKVGAEFVMMGAKWRAVQVVGELDAWTIQARLV